MQILKRDLDAPKLLNVAVNKLTDYPPKFTIYIIQTLNQTHSELPKLLVQGLDIEDCSFKLITPTTGEP